MSDKLRVYVASSWRNLEYSSVVLAIREAGHECYDFQAHSFGWGDLDPEFESWSDAEFCQRLRDPACQDAFARDRAALDACHVCVALLPCGNSSHLELGYARGKEKFTVIQLDGGRPDLMYLLADEITLSIRQTLGVLSRLASTDGTKTKDPP